MKNLRVLAMVVAGLRIFNACQKSELEAPQLADDAQSQEVIKPDVYSENGYLVFKTKDYFCKRKN